MRYAGALIVVAMTSSCGLLLDIDGVEFGEPTAANGGGGSTSSSSDGGSGGSVGGQGGSAGALTECEVGVCVPQAPAGWEGPMALHDEAGCLPDWPTIDVTLGIGNVTAGGVTCTACGCGNPTGVTCSLPLVTAYNDSVCNAQSGTVVPAAGGACTVTGDLQAWSVLVAVSTPSGGSCAASGGAVSTTPMAAFDSYADLCSGDPPTTTCGAGICVPPAERLCVSQAGDVPCEGAFTDRTLAHADFDDTRDCSTCICEGPTGTCSGSVATFDEADCTVPLATAAANGNCEDTVDDVMDAVIYTAGGFTGGDCNEVGGQPVGTVTPIQPVTVCCLPQEDG